MQKRKELVVLGGGISGLSSAWFADKKFGSNAKITLFEQRAHPGGWIHTAHKDGFLFECGPSSLRSIGDKGGTTLQLIEELGLKDEVISCSEVAKKNRFIFTGGRIQVIPSSLGGLLTSPLTRKAILPVLKEWAVPKRTDAEDESIHSFFSRRFSPYVADTFADALVLGIYAGDSKKLSLRSCFPFLYDLEQQHGGILRGGLHQLGKSKPKSDTKVIELSPWVKQMQKERVYSFRNGLQTLTDTLYAQLQTRPDDISLFFKAEIAAMKLLDNDTNQSIELSFADGRTKTADSIVCSLPSHSLARILVDDKYSPLRDALLKIPYASAAVVHLAYKDSVLPPEAKGFGYLVPQKEKETILGMQWNSMMFPQQETIPGCTRVTVMMRLEEGKSSPDPEHWKGVAMDAINRHLGVTQQPTAYNVALDWKAIPQYHVGHHKLVEEIEQRTHQLFKGKVVLAGNSWHAVSVNDCVVTANKVIDSLSL